MAKGGNGGGKGGGGGDGGDGGTILIKGGRDDDDLYLPSERTILNTSFDGGRGSDTLFLSNHSDGVTVKLNNGPSSQSIVSTDDFTGTMWSLGSYTNLSNRLDGSIKNVENIVGTSGNDRLHISDSGRNLLDGGAGNDALTVVSGGGDTLIGGTGEDWLLAYHPGNLLVGGTWGADGPAGDGQTDVFSLTQGTILDFEIGIDKIMIEVTDYASMNAILDATWTLGTWVDSDGVTRSGSQLEVAPGYVINLADVHPDDANGIEIGFVIGTFGEEPVHGGPGDDILYASNYADTFEIGPNAGDDMIVHFDTSQDVLSFSGEAPGEDDWVPVDVNGQQGIRWTYDSGQSSITILGVTTAEGLLIIEDGSTDFTSSSAMPSGDGLLM